MPTRSRANRMHVQFAALIAGLTLFPQAIGSAAEPEQAGRDVAVLRGRVTDADDNPLADVRVRIAIPAADMRFVDSSTSHKRLETRTDASGNYRLEVPGLAEPTQVSIDAMKPGYRRLVGTLMSGGDARRAEVAPGKAVESDMRLMPALYFAGTVVDEQGQPIAGVHVSANASSSRASGGVEKTASNADGAFELFNYSLEPVTLENEATRGAVYFFHPDYLDHRIDDVYTIEAKDQKSLHIVLKTGHRIAGTVIDVDGKPVPDAMVKALRTDGSHRKAIVTDAKGMFVLRGLAPGLTRLSVRALAIKQKALVPVAVKGDKDDLEVRLRKIEFPANLKVRTVLGMQLADLTPELKDAYGIQNKRGAVIVDPGEDSDRLRIGELAEGYCFWMVGKERVGNVRELVEQILAETANQNAETYAVRVVYSLSTPEFDGTNTQYLRVTKEDLKQLQAVLDEVTNETE